MILNTAPQNEAILSNVGEIGEFRIRNSAKAFNILSSGLYANKIRAIIRELSCNAVDSHVAAGKQKTPFDVHLPNQLEPHFSIRDYGTGLDHEQVTSIYTTYFESTKTDSNAFIGALGLGSKSPFSYTDNFTVTAVKNGVKGIYTAFINNEGVPSIALMGQEETDEPSGVEIKFAVDDRWEFSKFRDEARHVYKYFGLRPVISGSAEFTFVDPEYESKDIIPGVHAYKSGSTSYAVMGNIAYPIDVPNADKALGELRGLLGCGLEMHFAIGELDFQASREGLSYIPSTIEAIRCKLEAFNSVLTSKLAAEADAIENLWDRALFLYTKKDIQLWRSAVVDYASTANLPTFDLKQYSNLTCFQLKEDDLAANYNIQIRALLQSRGSKTMNNGKTETVWTDTLDANGVRITYRQWGIGVSGTCHFVINDTKTGAGERVRYHYRKNDPQGSRTIWVLERADKNKEMDATAFFTAIHNPPKDRQILASSLEQKPRHSLGRDVSILVLERRGGGSGYNRDNDMVWRDAGASSKFDANETYYYVPLSGFQMESTKGYTGGKDLYEDVTSMPGLFRGNIYGVRKKDIEDIKKKPNWKNFEEHIAQELGKKDLEPLMRSLAVSDLDRDEVLKLSNTEICRYVEANSDYEVFVNKFKGVDKFRGSVYNVKRLFEKFAPGTAIDPTATINKYQAELNRINEKYPLLRHLSSYRTDAKDIAEYINLIDTKKED